jgi:hypothetical protein
MLVLWLLCPGMQSPGGYNTAASSESEHRRGVEAQGDGGGFPVGDEEPPTPEQKTTVNVKQLKRAIK